MRLLSTTALFLALLSPALQAEKPAQPNVLLIMVDDLGYGDLSSYGGTDIRTPHIDRLMGEGLRFNQFYANCCVCSPTRAALLSGRYPEFVGVPGVIRHYREGNWGYLTPDSVMLPELFQKAGYHTSLIGKWHLGLREENWPNNRGFEEFHGWLGDMMEDYWKHTRGGNNYMRWNKELIRPEGHATDLFTAWSIASLQRRAKEKRPFFQFLSYNAPHDPIHPPQDWLEKVKKREKDISDKRAGLVALIEHLDDGIGQVLKAIDDLGFRNDTIVIFTSDNGGALRFGASNGDLRLGKTNVYEGGLKVNTCVRWPGKIKAGGQTEFRALTMDLVPTLADLAGVKIPHEIEGRSLKPLVLTGKQEPLNRPDFYMWLQKGTKEAMRLGDWKLVRDKAGKPWELYNIAKDHRETTDLAAKEPERLKEMVAMLEAHMKKAQEVPWQRPSK